MEFDSDWKVQAKPFFLGVLGSHSNVSRQDMVDQILHPLVSIMGRLPEKVTLPSEGLSSAHISIWAERSGVDLQSLEADWKRFQRKAAILRDARILKESTHLLIFLGPRSKSNEATALREARRGKRVFVVDHTTLEVTEYVVE